MSYHPGAILMDLHPAIRKLQDRVLIEMEVACSDDGAAYFTDQLIEDVVSCIDQENMAMSCLYDYADRQKQSLLDCGRDAEAQRMASEIVDFGRDLINNFKEHRVYENGQLNYVFSGRCASKTLILSRYC
jgi:hypothetical protein